MHTRIALALAMAALGLVALIPGVTGAAVPAGGTVSAATPNATWTGGPFLASNPSGVCLTDLDPACDTYALTIVSPAAGDYTVDIGITTADGNDLDLYVYNTSGARVGSSATESGNESVTLTNPAAGTYKVRVLAFLVTPGTTYNGTAKLNAGSAVTPDRRSVLWSWSKTAPQASVEVPLRVVLVGFNASELGPQLLSEIPNFQRPGVLIPRGQNPSGDTGAFFGNETLINHGRRYYDGGSPFLVPYEYKWKPQLIVAPDAFSDGLLSAMNTSSTTGEFSSSAKRQFLETYNTTRGTQYRGSGKQVAANQPVRFVNGEAVEDWIAANSKRHLGFDFAARGKGPGANPGYTVFILNTWDSPQALRHLHPEHEYHVFKIDRTDPDTKTFDGIDWARVWGGRYRFMMVDTGAAPNAYEGETWGNRGRGVNGSAGYDPPLWEYRANAPRPVTLANVTQGVEQAVTPGATWNMEHLNADLARTVNQAASFRFLHSYLYEPWPGTGKFYLSDNVWHDTFAEVPFASDLSKLYDQATVIKGLSTLTPYFQFGGDVSFEYLTQGGAEYDSDQNMLQQAKQNGDDVAGTPFTAMNTVTAMDHVDANARLSQRGAPCATSVKGLSVVVEKHYAWSLPVIVAGIAPNREGVPFGYLNSVSDLTKYSGADRDEAIAAIHPQAFSGAFTYTAVHEASHYLGLAHPHDSVGATRRADGSPRYYDGFTWTFNTTAAPTTYSHVELVYSILDQESIARGHSAYYLKWTDEALEDAGKAWEAAGKTTIGQLSEEARRLRAEAVDSSRKAEKLFARFDFINATFAAQRAWRAAAAYRDLAKGLAAGTSELERGTKLAGAESCASAQQSGASTGTLHVHADGSTDTH